MPPVGARFRIYVDTSVLGGCFDEEFATWSNALVRDFRTGRLIPVLSDVTAAEVQDAPESVRNLHYELLKVPRIRAVEMTRKIRDRHARRLAGKTAEEVIAFYRAAGQAALKGARQRAKPRSRRVG